MPIVVTVQEAEADLPGLLRRAEGGESVLITRDGGAAVRLVVEGTPAGDAGDRASEAGRRLRALGSLRGRLRVPEDFDAPLPDDLLDAFEGIAPGDASASGSGPRRPG
jgi:antitoxin (DNA-binding transcriptional repressor) of toxin-antitoxin stability system